MFFHKVWKCHWNSHGTVLYNLWWKFMRDSGFHWIHSAIESRYNHWVIIYPVGMRDQPCICYLQTPENTQWINDRLFDWPTDTALQFYLIIEPPRRDARLRKTHRCQQYTNWPDSKLFFLLVSSFRSPVSPSSPKRVTETLASVPAPRLLPVKTVIL